MSKLRGFIVTLDSRKQRIKHRHVFGHSEVANAFFQMLDDAERWRGRWERDFPTFKGRLKIRRATLTVRRAIP